MKTLTTALTLVLTTCALGLGYAAVAGPGDEAAVRRAVLDYCEAFYEAKPEYLERSVSKSLTKFGYYQKDGAYTGVGMTFDQAVGLAKEWNASGKKDTSQKTVQILDVLDQTACAKLTANWGIDYLLLAREDGKWMIRHVLWQSHPPARD